MALSRVPAVSGGGKKGPIQKTSSHKSQFTGAQTRAISKVVSEVKDTFETTKSHEEANSALERVFDTALSQCNGDFTQAKNLLLEMVSRNSKNESIRQLLEGSIAYGNAQNVPETTEVGKQLSESMQRMTLGIGDSTADGESKGGINVSEAVIAILTEFGINESITDETERLQYASLFLRIKNPETEERKLPEDVEELVNYIHQLLPEGEDPVPFFELGYKFRE